MAKIPEGIFSCQQTADCPPGFACNAVTRFCERAGAAMATEAAAGMDAPPMDAASSDRGAEPPPEPAPARGGVDAATPPATPAETPAPSDAGVAPSPPAQAESGMSEPDAGTSCATLCEGACRDLRRDSNHCGWCGHSCLGGPCYDGACGWTVLGEANGQIRDFEVDASGVYYTEFAPGTWTAGSVTRLVRMELDGSNRSAIATVTANVSSPGEIALGPASVYWSAGDGAILEVPHGSASGTRVAGAVVDGSVLAFRDELLYYNGPSPDGAWTRSLLEQSVRGGEPRALLQENVQAFDSIAVDSSYVYFTIPGANRLEAVTGGSHVGLAGGEVNPRDLQVDANGLYWISLAGTSLRLKVREHGGRILTLALEAGPFALDETHVYFADAAGLARVPKTGGDSQQVTRLPGRALEVALHASHVYAVVPESPTRIYRVPK